MYNCAGGHLSFDEAGLLSVSCDNPQPSSEAFQAPNSAQLDVQHFLQQEILPEVPGWILAPASVVSLFHIEMAVTVVTLDAVRVPQSG